MTNYREGNYGTGINYMAAPHDRGGVERYNIVKRA